MKILLQLTVIFTLLLSEQMAAWLRLSDGKHKGKQILKKQSIQEMLKFQFTKNQTPENVNPDKLNSGLFWATKMGGIRIGHNGSDPGVRTFMLSDLDKEVAIILFSNTSLSESEDKFFDLYNDLYKFGLTIRYAECCTQQKII
jgi:CubicO group peptidase (beta-lactamase class C family)